MYPDAVIFDFDGVIVDTEPIHYQAFQKILTPLGLEFTWHEYKEHYMGFDDRDAFREAYKRAKKSLDDKNLYLLIDKKAILFEEISLEASPYPGVLNLIKELIERKIPLAISSGALRSDIIPILKKLHLLDSFTHIVSAEDVSLSKPNPASYITAKKLLLSSFSKELNENSLIFAIEDTPAGIQSAQGAGLRVIAVTNSYAEEVLIDGDLIVNELSELLGGHWT